MLHCRIRDRGIERLGYLEETCIIAASANGQVGTACGGAASPRRQQRSKHFTRRLNASRAARFPGGLSTSSSRDGPTRQVDRKTNSQEPAVAKLHVTRWATSNGRSKWRPRPPFYARGTGQIHPFRAPDAQRGLQVRFHGWGVGPSTGRARSRGIASEPAPPIIERTGWAGRRCRHPRGEW